MALTQTKKRESAITLGIKTVGVGKKGSHDLDPELVRAICAELKQNNTPPAALGAFFAGLFLKGVTTEEQMIGNILSEHLLTSPQKIADTIASNAPASVKSTCARVLAGETLDKNEAYQIGQFLFSSLPGDGARGILASALRVRYETADEYEGLLTAMQE